MDTRKCMPNVTSMKPFAFLNARKYPIIDRCGNTEIDYKLYENAGKHSFRNYQTENYEYIIPIEEDKAPKFSEKVAQKPFPDRYTLDEIDCMIREWLVKERVTIMQLFKSFEASGASYITKESLLKILFHCCRHIKIDQFYKLLERYELNRQSVITFDQFEKTFSAPPLGHFKSPVIFHGMGSQYKVASSFAMRLIREAAMDKDFNLTFILPKSCFKKNKLVLMPQFREALSRIKINMCDEDFIRLWNRIDTNGVGSVHLKKLLEIMNLQDDGTPMCGLRETFVPQKINKPLKPTRYKCPLKYTNCYALANKDKLPDVKAGGVSFPITKPTCWKPHGPGGTNDYQFGRGSQFAEGLDFLRERRPKFHSIVNTLAYIFSEPYQSMLITFERFDSHKSGFVLLCDGLKILCEYDFNVELSTLEKFLIAHNCLDSHKGMNYRRLLNYFTNKRQECRVNRAIEQIILSQNQASGIRSLNTMSVEEVEQMLYKILHKDYIQFLTLLQKCSPDSKLILEKNLCGIIEKILGYKINEDQLEDLRDELEYDLEIGDEQNRLVNFRSFLQKFGKPSTVCRFRTNPELAEKSDIWKKKIWRGKPVYDPFRDIPFICKLVLRALKKRFHNIDKEYKSIVNNSSEKISKETLMELLNQEKCALTPPEMDMIWQIAEKHPDYSNLKYRQIIKYLMINLDKLAKEYSIETRRNKMPDNNLKIVSEFRQQHKSEREHKLEDCRHKIRMSQQNTRFQPDQQMTQETIKKMMPKMEKIWKNFKQQLRKNDITGTTCLELFKMKELIIRHDFGISDREIENLLYSFDKSKNGQFHYIDFLMEFAELNISSSDQQVPILHFDRVKHKFMNKKTGLSITITDTYKEIRNTLIKRWESLIRAFRKIDSEKIGKLTKDQLKKVLLESGIELSDDDLYHLFSSFDTDLDGKVDYIEFIEQLLDVFIPNKLK